MDLPADGGGPAGSSVLIYYPKVPADIDGPRRHVLGYDKWQLGISRDD